MGLVWSINKSDKGPGAHPGKRERGALWRGEGGNPAGCPPSPLERIARMEVSWVQKIGWEYEALFDVEQRTELEMQLWQNNPCSIKVGSMGYRTKTTRAGKRLEVDVYPVFGYSDRIRAREAKKQVTPETMRRVNLANAKRRIVQLADANFTEQDIHLTLTYENPPIYSRCQKDVQNFLKAVKRRREKQGLPELKYIYVIEDDQDGQKKRIHTHILMSGGMDREELEALWEKGYANADRLAPDERGLEAVARYLVKSQRNRRKWCSSKNLKKPDVRVSDCKLSNAKVKRIARNLPNEAKEILRKAYPGYEYVECKVKFSDQLDGCYIRALMRKVDVCRTRKS